MMEGADNLELLVEQCTSQKVSTRIIAYRELITKCTSKAEVVMWSDYASMDDTHKTLNNLKSDLFHNTSDIAYDAIGLCGCLFANESFLSLIQIEQEYDILDVLLKAIKESKEKRILTRALWSLSRSKLNPKVYVKRLKCVISNLNEVLKSDESSSITVYEALQVFQSLIETVPEEMVGETKDWFIPVFSYLFHSAARVRAAALSAVVVGEEIIQKNNKTSGIKSEISKLLIPDLKSKYCKQMNSLLGEESVDILKEWRFIVHFLGKELHSGTSLINGLLEVVERGFKSNKTEVRVEAFKCWQALIDNFSLDENILINHKRLKLLLAPLKAHNTRSEDIAYAKLLAWWHLVLKLGKKAASNIDTVIIPLLRYCFGNGTKSPGAVVGLAERNLIMSGAAASPGRKFSGLYVVSAEILGQILSTGINVSGLQSYAFSMPRLEEPILTSPSIFIRNHHLLLGCVSEAVQSLNSQDRKQYALGSFLFQSVLAHLRIILTTEALRKDSIEPVKELFSIISSLESQCQPQDSQSHFVFKFLEMTTTGPLALPKHVLNSRQYHIATGNTIRDMMSGTLVNYILNQLCKPTLLYFATIREGFFTVWLTVLASSNPSTGKLGLLQSVVKELDSAAAFLCPANPNTLTRMWSTVVALLIQHIEETQEIDQGDGSEHDWSCIYSVLLFPFRHSVDALGSAENHVYHQIMKDWNVLWLKFIELTPLTPTAEPNSEVEYISQSLVQLCNEKLTAPPDVHAATYSLMSDALVILTEKLRYSELGKTSVKLIHSPAKPKKKPHPLHNLASSIELFGIIFPRVLRMVVAQRQHTASRLCEAITQVFKGIHQVKMIDALVSNVVDPLTQSLKVNPAAKFNSEVEKKFIAMFRSFATMVEEQLGTSPSAEQINRLAPLFQTSLMSSNSHIKNEARKLWKSSFASTKHTIPAGLFKVLQESGLPPASLNDTEEHLEESESLSPKENVPVYQAGSFLKREKGLDKTPKGNLKGKVLGTETPKSGILTPNSPFSREIRSKRKISLGDMKDEDFVKVVSPKPSRRVLTEHQIERMKEHKVDIPALYSDISQQSTQAELPPQFASQSSFEESQCSWKSEDAIFKKPTEQNMGSKDQLANTDDNGKTSDQQLSFSGIFPHQNQRTAHKNIVLISSGTSLVDVVSSKTIQEDQISTNEVEAIAKQSAKSKISTDAKEDDNKTIIKAKQVTQEEIAIANQEDLAPSKNDKKNVEETGKTTKSNQKKGSEELSKTSTVEVKAKTQLISRKNLRSRSVGGESASSDVQPIVNEDPSDMDALQSGAPKKSKEVEKGKSLERNEKALTKDLEETENVKGSSKVEPEIPKRRGRKPKGGGKSVDEKNKEAEKKNTISGKNNNKQNGKGVDIKNASEQVNESVDNMEEANRLEKALPEEQRAERAELDDAELDMRKMSESSKASVEKTSEKNKEGNNEANVAEVREEIEGEKSTEKTENSTDVPKMLENTDQENTKSDDVQSSGKAEEGSIENADRKSSEKTMSETEKIDGEMVSENAKNDKKTNLRKRTEMTKSENIKSYLKKTGNVPQTDVKRYSSEESDISDELDQELSKTSLDFERSFSDGSLKTYSKKKKNQESWNQKYYIGEDSDYTDEYLNEELRKTSIELQKSLSDSNVQVISPEANRRKSYTPVKKTWEDIRKELKSTMKTVQSDTKDIDSPFPSCKEIHKQRVNFKEVVVSPSVVRDEKIFKKIAEVQLENDAMDVMLRSKSGSDSDSDSDEEIPNSQDEDSLNIRRLSVLSNKSPSISPRKLSLGNRSPSVSPRKLSLQRSLSPKKQKPQDDWNIETEDDSRQVKRGRRRKPDEDDTTVVIEAKKKKTEEEEIVHKSDKQNCSDDSIIVLEENDKLSPSTSPYMQLDKRKSKSREIDNDTLAAKKLRKLKSPSESSQSSTSSQSSLDSSQTTLPCTPPKVTRSGRKIVPPNKDMPEPMTPPGGSGQKKPAKSPDTALSVSFIGDDVPQVKISPAISKTPKLSPKKSVQKRITDIFPKDKDTKGLEPNTEETSVPSIIPDTEDPFENNDDIADSGREIEEENDHQVQEKPSEKLVDSAEIACEERDESIIKEDNMDDRNEDTKEHNMDDRHEETKVDNMDDRDEETTEKGEELHKVTKEMSKGNSPKVSSCRKSVEEEMPEEKEGDMSIDEDESHMSTESSDHDNANEGKLAKALPVTSGQGESKDTDVITEEAKKTLSGDDVAEEEENIQNEVNALEGIVKLKDDDDKKIAEVEEVPKTSDESSSFENGQVVDEEFKEVRKERGRSKSSSYKNTEMATIGCNKDQEEDSPEKYKISKFSTTLGTPERKKKLIPKIAGSRAALLVACAKQNLKNRGAGDGDSPSKLGSGGESSRSRHGLSPNRSSHGHVSPSSTPPSRKRKHMDSNENERPWIRHEPSPGASPSTSILKKTILDDSLTRDTPSPPPSKQRRVSFADPPVSERVEIPSSPKTLKGMRAQKRLDMTKAASPRKDQEVSLGSQQESQEPDSPPALDCSQPLYPALIGCQDKVDQVAALLTSPALVEGLIAVLNGRGVTTVGQLCSLTEADVCKLPVRAPKIAATVKILKSYEERSRKSKESIHPVMDDVEAQLSAMFGVDKENQHPNNQEVSQENTKVSDTTTIDVEELQEETTDRDDDDRRLSRLVDVDGLGMEDITPLDSLPDDAQEMVESISKQVDENPEVLDTLISHLSTEAKQTLFGSLLTKLNYGYVIDCFYRYLKNWNPHDNT